MKKELTPYYWATIGALVIIVIALGALDAFRPTRTIVRHVTETQQTFLQQQESSALSNCSGLAGSNAYEGASATAYATCVKQIIATFHAP